LQFIRRGGVFRKSNVTKHENKLTKG
jgi:hypothetical protein